MTFTLRLTKGTASGAFKAFTPPHATQSVAATKSGSDYAVDDASMAALIATATTADYPGSATSRGLEIDLTIAARSLLLVQLP